MFRRHRIKPKVITTFYIHRNGENIQELIAFLHKNGHSTNLNEGEKYLSINTPSGDWDSSYTRTKIFFGQHLAFRRDDEPPYRISKGELQGSWDLITEEAIQ
jgi:hypothetical protein